MTLAILTLCQNLIYANVTKLVAVLPDRYGWSLQTGNALSLIVNIFACLLTIVPKVIPSDEYLAAVLILFIQLNI